MYFFEDDIAHHLDKGLHYPAIIFRAMEIAEADGVMYLGACGPQRTGDVYYHNSVESVRIQGRCAHAFGVAKWRVESFLKELSLLKGDADMLYLDVQLSVFAMTKPILLVGSNLTSPFAVDHFGLFWQDRFTFQTGIGRF